MSIKKGLAVLGVCLFSLLSAFGQELTERSRLGAVIEGVTYLSSGNLAGRVAFMDCWGIYTCDLMGGGYKKLCSVENINLGVWPRGIGYIGQGEFAGNFLLASLSYNNALFLVSSSGSLISKVEVQDFQWGGCEGLTEISSGLYAGKMAMLGHTGVAGGDLRHIYIFRLENRGNGVVYAFLEKDLTEEHIPDPYEMYSISIAFLPADFPLYPNHFVVGDVGGSMRVYDEQGTLKSIYSGIPFMEGMTYIGSGIHQGKLFITEMTASQAAVRNLDGSQSTPIEITIGVAGFGASTVTWLKNSRQLVGFSWTGYYWQWPMYVLSRPYPGQWSKDDVLPYTHFRAPRNMTDMTSAGTYCVYGTLGTPQPPGKSPFEVHILDSDFQFVRKIELPSQYSAEAFARLVYVPGATASDDRYLLTKPLSVYSFDSNFSYPAEVIDLSGKVTSLYRLCYDPAIMRYYALDNGGLTLRVFDRNWDPLTTYNLSSYIVRGFSEITKFTSGDLEDNVGLLGGLERGDNEMVIVNFEYQIAADLLGMLNQAVLGSGIKSGLSKELSKELNIALKSVESKNIRAAVNQIREFQASVRSQRGKGIPVNLADTWLYRSEEIIRGLLSL